MVPCAECEAPKKAIAPMAIPPNKGTVLLIVFLNLLSIIDSSFIISEK
ncbi:hypothetical protein CWATWH0402_3654 [Crocosphaera watsonii WH 0402]|uniref:Uncharacterized protein n=1 Tax=Crocosphaera watsonii WH 0402 TaxID=1284629 RepID=T2JRM8_CROWT|nr:hypothetical protein CWATWH0402_3654 [Crocosphaera watsonii WH 0402]